MLQLALKESYNYKWLLGRASYKRTKTLYKLNGPSAGLTPKDLPVKVLYCPQRTRKGKCWQSKLFLGSVHSLEMKKVLSIRYPNQGP